MMFFYNPTRKYIMVISLINLISFKQNVRSEKTADQELL